MAIVKIIIAFSFAFIATLWAAEVIEDESDGKIVGGKYIELREAPYMAQVQIIRNATLFSHCGGSIISPNTILTAAHCTFKYGPRQIIVRVGTKHKSLGGELFRVSKIINFPDFDPVSHDFDAALLILSRPITLVPRKTEIVRLPGKDEEIADGTLLFVSGWGATNSINEKNDQLRGVEVPSVNFDKCEEAYGYLIEENMCAGDFDKGGKDSCQGDSGGPLVKKPENKQIGIVSKGNDCALAKFPGINARVSAFRTWIDANMKK